ncbi:hypothetical protein SRHO_G00143660 [Serrasalmus rhombeus]
MTSATPRALWRSSSSSSSSCTGGWMCRSAAAWTWKNSPALNSPAHKNYRSDSQLTEENAKQDDGVLTAKRR